MSRSSLLVVLLALPAFAQVPVPKQPAVKPVPTQRVDFGEGDLIEGTLATSEGQLVTTTRRPRFERFKFVRENFDDKLMASVDEM